MKSDNSENIVIADDHAVVRYGMCMLLKEVLPFAEIFHAETFYETLKRLEERPATLIVLDINIPGGNSINMISSIQALQPGAKILIFSGYDEMEYGKPYMLAGAKGYLSKQTLNAEIKRAVRTVMNGSKYISDNLKNILIDSIFEPRSSAENPLAQLSNRETEVAKLLISGHGLKDIAGILNIQISTVSTYKIRIFEKLKINHLPQLIEKFKTAGALY